MNLEPRIIIFLGGLIALTGTFLTIYGTLMHNKASSEKSTKILEATNKSLLTSTESLEKAIESLDKLVKIQEDTKLINENITGGKSFPLVKVKIQNNNKISSFYLRVVGENNLRNLKFTNLNISQIERFHQAFREDLAANNSITKFTPIESIKTYNSEKAKAYMDLSIIKQDDFSPKSEKYIGDQGYFTGSPKGVITAILIEASNGNYYHLYNWGLVENFIHLPFHNLCFEDVLYNEEGNVLYSNLRKEDWFYYKHNKFRKLETINFEKVKEYFEERKKLSFENKDIKVP